MFQKRGQLTPRQRLAHLIDRGSPFLEISTLAGLEMHDDDGAENIQGGGVIAGIGYVCGVRCDDHRQRLRHQGRHHRADGPAQEPARAGDRAAQQAALHLAGRVGRRQPQLPGRDLRRRRPHLRQHGAHVGHGHPAHRRRARLLHRRRRLSPGPLRLRRRGQEALQDLPRRPAAAEGRHRRDRHRRGAGRRRDAHDGVGRRRVPGRGRRRRAAHRARDHGRHALERAPAAAAAQGRPRSRATAPTSSAASCRSTTASPTTCAR